MTRVLESWAHAMKNVYIGASTMQRSSWQVWLSVSNKIFLIFTAIRCLCPSQDSNRLFIHSGHRVWIFYFYLFWIFTLQFMQCFAVTLSIHCLTSGQFCTVHDILQTTDRSLCNIQRFGSANGIQRLPHCWECMIHNGGGYIEGL